MPNLTDLVVANTGDTITGDVTIGGNLLIDSDNTVTINSATNISGATNITGELKATSLNENVINMTPAGTVDIDCEVANVWLLSTSSSTTFTFSNPPPSLTAFGFSLRVRALGTIALTWPSSVDWPGGSAPDAPANGETDWYVFLTVNGGTEWFGFQAGDALA